MKLRKLNIIAAVVLMAVAALGIIYVYSVRQNQAVNHCNYIVESQSQESPKSDDTPRSFTRDESYDKYCLGHGGTLTDDTIVEYSYYGTSEATQEDSYWIDYLRNIEIPIDNTTDYWPGIVSSDYYFEFSADRDTVNSFFRCDKYVLYNQVVNGYKVYVRINQNIIVICFEDIKNRNKIVYIEEVDEDYIRSPINLYLRYDEIGRDNYVFKVDYKSYTSQEIVDNNGCFIYYNSLFQFVDVDFDGNKELLISQFSGWREGDKYKVYKIIGDELVELDYPPFNSFVTSTCAIFPKSEMITVRGYAGAFYFSEMYFSKRKRILKNQAYLPKIEPETLELMPNIEELKEYFTLDSVQFTLDSIVYIYPHLNSSSEIVDTTNVFRFEY